MYNIKDNTEGQLQVAISSTTTTLVLQAGHGNRFPATPFLVVLNQRDTQGNIIKSEKIEATARNRDQLTVVRGFDGSTPHGFQAGDFVSLFILAKHIEDIKTETGNLKTRIETVNGNLNNYVAKNGNITINGTKTFSSPVIVANPTADNHAVNKTTMDTAIADAIEASWVVSKLTETLYPLWEPVTKNDCLFVEDAGRIEDITTFQAIGKETTNKQVAHKIIGNGVSGNSISLPLCAVGNSPIPLTVRIEGGENQPNGQLVHTQAQATISKTQMAYHPIVIEAGYDRDESTSNRYNAITFTAKRDFVCVGLIKSTRCNATGAELKIRGATKTTGTVTGNTIIRSQAQVITAGQQVELWATGGTRKAAK